MSNEKNINNKNDNPNKETADFYLGIVALLSLSPSLSLENVYLLP